MMEHFNVKFGDLSCIDFEISHVKQTDRETDRETDRQTDKRF